MVAALCLEQLQLQLQLVQGCQWGAQCCLWCVYSGIWCAAHVLVD
jgi:hypothetical protein